MASIVTRPTRSRCVATLERPPLATPVIDGELDCGPAAVAITPVGWNGTTTLPSSHSARVAAAWRPNGIYVYVEVTGT